MLIPITMTLPIEKSVEIEKRRGDMPRATYLRKMVLRAMELKLDKDFDKERFE